MAAGGITVVPSSSASLASRDRQRVLLQTHLVAAVQFALVEHAVLLEQRDRLGLIPVRAARPAWS